MIGLLNAFIDAVAISWGLSFMDMVSDMYLTLL
jgi:hypothetical protein